VSTTSAADWTDNFPLVSVSARAETGVIFLVVAGSVYRVFIF